MSILKAIGITPIPKFDGLDNTPGRTKPGESTSRQKTKQLKCAAHRVQKNIGKDHSRWATQWYPDTLAIVPAKLHDMKEVTSAPRTSSSLTSHHRIEHTTQPDQDSCKLVSRKRRSNTAPSRRTDETNLPNPITTATQTQAKGPHQDVAQTEHRRDEDDIMQS